MTKETTIEELKRRYPKMFERLPKSKATAIKLKCLECEGGSVAEVRRCTVTGCPLYVHRPYK